MGHIPAYCQVYEAHFAIDDAAEHISAKNTSFKEQCVGVHTFFAVGLSASDFA